MTPLFLAFVVAGGSCWAYVLYYVAQLILHDTQQEPGLIRSQTIRLLVIVSVPTLFCLLVTKTPPTYQWATFIFASALIIASITDLQSLLISRFTSLFLVPVGLIFAWLNLLPIKLSESITGAFFGYFLLKTVSYIFYAITKKHGLGQGDSDLLALIGAFTGPIGVWFSLLLGSLFGSVVGISLIACRKAHRSTLIPFGPFIALGALLHLLYGPTLLTLFTQGHLVQ